MNNEKLEELEIKLYKIITWISENSKNDAEYFDAIQYSISIFDEPHAKFMHMRMCARRPEWN